MFWNTHSSSREKIFLFRCVCEFVYVEQRAKEEWGVIYVVTGTECIKAEIPHSLCCCRFYCFKLIIVSINYFNLLSVILVLKTLCVKLLYFSVLIIIIDISQFSLVQKDTCMHVCLFQDVWIDFYFYIFFSCKSRRIKIKFHW